MAYYVLEVGQTLQAGLTTTSDGSTLADTGTLPVATVTLPDGTSTTASVVKTSTGTYSATLVTTQAGRHRVRWTASGVNSGGTPKTEVFDVWPVDPRLIIGLEDARAALNVPPATRVNDDELRLYIAAATPVIEDLVGPVLINTVTEHRSGSGKFAIALHDFPTAITSVVEDGTTLAATDYCWDEAGLLWRGPRPGAGSWSINGARNVVITYTVGESAIDPNVILAAREMVRIQYQRGQQGQRPAFGGKDSGPAPVIYAGWGRMNELLAAAKSNKVPGFA